MKKKELRKIRLNKIVISRIDENQTDHIKGGRLFTISFSCFCTPFRPTSETSSNAVKKCTAPEDTRGF